MLDLRRFPVVDLTSEELKISVATSKWNIISKEDTGPSKNAYVDNRVFDDNKKSEYNGQLEPHLYSNKNLAGVKTVDIKSSGSLDDVKHETDPPLLKAM